MTEAERLHREICADLDNDAPRRAYAEAIRGTDPEHAQLIELQLEIAQLDPPEQPVERDRLVALLETTEVLLDAHRARLAEALLPHVVSVGFHRGFPAEITVTSEAFLAHAERLFSAAPIQFVRLTTLPEVGLGPVLAVPKLAQLRGLDLTHLPICDDGAEALASCPYLSDLRWLGLTDSGVRVRGARALAASTTLSSLGFIDSASNPIPLTPTPTVGPDWTITGWRVPGGLKMLEKVYGPRRWFTGIAKSMHHHPPAWHHL